MLELLDMLWFCLLQMKISFYMTATNTLLPFLTTHLATILIVVVQCDLMLEKITLFCISKVNTTSHSFRYYSSKEIPDTQHHHIVVPGPNLETLEANNTSHENNTLSNEIHSEGEDTDQSGIFSSFWPQVSRFRKLNNFPPRRQPTSGNRTPLLLRATISNLKPRSVYVFQVRAGNENGYSQYSLAIRV